MQVLQDGRIYFFRGVRASVLLRVTRASRPASTTESAPCWQLGRATFWDEAELATALRDAFERQHVDDPDRPGSKVPVGIMFDIDDLVQPEEVESTLAFASKIGFERLSYPPKVPVPREQGPAPESNEGFDAQRDLDLIRRKPRKRKGS